MAVDGAATLAQLRDRPHVSSSSVGRDDNHHRRRRLCERTGTRIRRPWQSMGPSTRVNRQDRPGDLVAASSMTWQDSHPFAESSRQVLSCIARTKHSILYSIAQTPLALVNCWLILGPLRRPRLLQCIILVSQAPSRPKSCSQYPDWYPPASTRQPNPAHLHGGR